MGRYWYTFLFLCTVQTMRKYGSHNLHGYTCDERCQLQARSNKKHPLFLSKRVKVILNVNILPSPLDTSLHAIKSLLLGIVDRRNYGGDVLIR